MSSVFKRIPLKYKIGVCIISVFAGIVGYLETFTLNLDPVTRGRVLRVQIVIVIQCLLGLLSFFVWKNIGKVMDIPVCASNGKSSDKNIRKKEHSGGFCSALWKSAVIFYLFCAHFCYISNVFLVSTEPHPFTVLSFFLLGMHIQIASGLFAMKCISLILSWRGIHILKQRPAVYIALSYAIIMSFWGFYNAMKPPVIQHVTIPVKDLPDNLEGMTMTLIPDIHAGPMHGKTDVQNIVNQVNEVNADVVMIVGDLVDGYVSDLKEAIEPIKNIKAKYGKYFVTGNHEYYTMDIDNWIKHLSTLGVKTLRNEHVMFPEHLSEEGDKNQVCLAGVDDLEGKRIKYKNHGFDGRRAISSCPQDLPVILLAHQPKSAKLAFNLPDRLDLVLSGHTHGGQMFPLIIGAYLINPFYAGLYDVGKTSHIYVSQGTLYWGIPMRTFTNKEITVITLEKSLHTDPIKPTRKLNKKLNFNRKKP